MKKYSVFVLTIMLMSVLTLVVLYQSTNADGHWGDPYVDADASVTNYLFWTRAKATVDVGIKKPWNPDGQSYTGYGSVSVGFGNNTDTYTADLWASVIQRSWWFITWWDKDFSSTLSATKWGVVDPDLYVYASAYGYLGSASDNDYDTN